MALSTRIFIDFWNFQLNWNQRVPTAKCDWKKLPTEILHEAQRLLGDSGITEPCQIDETLVYASIDPTTEKSLKGWLENFLERQPSFRITTRERRPRPGKIHCRACGEESAVCPKCGEGYVKRAEKGIDAHIVTDLLSLAWQEAFDVAVLVSSDADFVPAVARVQEKGLKVVNASWAGHGHEVKKACWASFDLDVIAPNIRR